MRERKGVQRTTGKIEGVGRSTSTNSGRAGGGTCLVKRGWNPVQRLAIVHWTGFKSAELALDPNAPTGETQSGHQR